MTRPSLARYFPFFLFAGVLFPFIACPDIAGAALATVSSAVIEDSDEPFNQRIYSYDMEIDSNGNVHIVYSKPTPVDNADIYYIRRVGGTWGSKTLLSSLGWKSSGSTFLEIGSDNLVHVSYIKNDGASGELIYRTINDGIPSSEVQVDGGGFHTRMQLDESNHPIFMRGANPGGVSSLAILTTDDDTTWTKSIIAMPSEAPSVTKFRPADFVYSGGTYHITYGDSNYTFMVLDGKNSTNKIEGTFHDFHYLTSNDGTNWTYHLIDNSHTLYSMEFWTDMALVAGRPLVAMYKYAEYGNKYNRGTSARLSEWTGSAWTHKIITNQIYPDTSEGMGVGLVVNGTGDYFGAWDFSPDYPQILPGSVKGNTAMRRSGPQNDWSPVEQLDAFSLEGRTRLRILGGKLYYLALGDYTDAKLYFREYSISELDKVLDPPPKPPPPPPTDSKGALPSVYHMLLNQEGPF